MSGGVSSKAGNNYEAFWGIDKICQILISNKDACSIYFENPTSGNNGFEFEVEEDEKTYFYQAKDYNQKWTIGKLISENIIKNFYDKMSLDKNYNCVFCTSSDCDMEYYIEKAKSSINLQIFIDTVAKTQQDKLNDLYSHIFDLIKPEDLNIEFPINFSDNDDEKLRTEKSELNKKVYDTTYDLLKRTKVIKKSTTALIEDISRSINTIFKISDNSKIEEGLFHFYNTEYCHKYTKADLFRIFKDKGYEFKDHAQDNSLIKKIEENNLDFVENTDLFYQKFSIEREDTNQIFSELLENNEKKYLFITGDAGYGKSIILKEVINKCIEEKLNVISFDIKNYQLTSLDNLGDILYSKKASPVEVLKDIAQNNKAVIFIDQLDSLSAVSGRHIENWNVINKLLKESIKYQNIKVVLACRKFDLEKDTRLREFQKSFKKNIKEFEVKKLNENQIKSTLINMGLEEPKITPNATKLFSVPLHLNLLYEIIQERENIELNYNSIVDLYDEFWDIKQANTPNWYNVIELMVDSLCESKSISVVSERLSQYKDDVDKMISSNIFTLKDNQIAFFHETFFDYCFARLLLSNQDRNLLSFILESGQSLFIRSNVRQALEYLKIKDENSYNTYLSDILNNKEVRYHIKFLILDLLVKSEILSEQEINILECLDKDFQNIMFEKYEYADLFFQMWYKNGLLIKYLRSENTDEIDLALKIIANHRIEHKYTQEISRILENLTESEMIKLIEFENTNLHRQSLILSLPFFLNENLFNLICRCIERKIIDAKKYLSNAYYTIKMDNIGDEKLFILFKLALKLVLEIENDEYKIRRELKLSDFNKFIAKNPKSFVDNVFNIFIDAIKTHSGEKYNGLYHDRVFWSRLYNHDNEGLISYFNTAFIELAKQSPELFWEFIAEYKHSEYETILFLILKGLLYLPISYSDRIIEYVTINDLYWDIGYSAGGDNYPTMLLIRKFSENCSDLNLSKLIEKLLIYKDNGEYEYYKHIKKEKRCINYSPIGKTQARFLDSIEKKRLKNYPKALAKLSEYRRKFKVSTFFVKPTGIQGGWVAPPIKNESIEKMTDEQWLKAIKEYNTEEGKEFLKGGARELSRVLEKVVQNAPSRFLNLAYQLDKEKTNYNYFSAILDGLRSSKNMLQEKIDLIKYCYELNRDVLARHILDLLHSVIEHPEFTFSGELLEILTWFGTDHEDPRRADIDNDIDFTAINCVRGKVSEVIRDLLNKDYTLLDNLLPIIQELITDTISVRAITALTLLPIYDKNKIFAYELFEQLVDTDEKILTSHYVQEFLNRTRFLETYDFQNRIFSGREYFIPEVQEYVAIVYCVYAVLDIKHKEQAEFCVNSDNVNYRIGSAKALSFMLQQEEHFANTFARESLLKLLNDNEDKVQESADDFINRKSVKLLLEDSSLFNQYMDTKSFEQSSKTSIAFELEEIIIKPQYLVNYIKFIKRYIESYQILVENNKHYDADTIFKILLKTYDVEENQELLNLIDEFLILPTSLYKDSIDKYERTILG
mgnify:CR=1 FL=1